MVTDKICNRVIEGQMSIFTALKKMDEERVKLLFVFEKSKFTQSRSSAASDVYKRQTHS